MSVAPPDRLPSALAAVTLPAPVVSPPLQLRPRQAQPVAFLPNATYPEQLRPQGHSVQGTDGRATVCIMKQAAGYRVGLALHVLQGLLDVDFSAAALRQLAAQLAAAADYIEATP